MAIGGGESLSPLMEENAFSGDNELGEGLEDGGLA